MTYQDVFEDIKTIFGKADVSEIKGRLAFQFNITGDVEGIFYVEVKDGQFSMEPYEYHDRDVLFISSARTLLSIANRKLDPVLAFTLGKMKVEGDMDKALLIQTFCGVR